MTYSSHARTILLSTLFLAITASGFFLARAIVGSEAKASDPISHLDGQSSASGTRPDPDSTPVPGATPDKSQTEWYVPYLNQERTAAKFHGELNGITLGAPNGPLPQCDRPALEPDWLKATRGTSFDLHLDALPAGVTLQGVPRVFRCLDDGRVMWIIANIEVASGSGVNGTTGVVQVSRGETVRWYEQEFLADKVTSSTIAGRPGISADVGVSGFGLTGVFVRDDDIQGSTALLSTNVSVARLHEIAEAMYR